MITCYEIKKSETNGNIKNAFKGVKDIENYKSVFE
jgi:hypothetical protein